MWLISLLFNTWKSYQKLNQNEEDVYDSSNRHNLLYSQKLIYASRKYTPVKFTGSVCQYC
jgi:hypothetical protein